jgi:hypothetical protein
MDSLDFHPGLQGSLPFYASRADHPVSGVAHLQGSQPLAVFYPFRHPTPYTHGNNLKGRST